MTRARWSDSQSDAHPAAEIRLEMATAWTGRIDPWRVHLSREFGWYTYIGLEEQPGSVLSTLVTPVDP